MLFDHLRVTKPKQTLIQTITNVTETQRQRQRSRVIGVIDERHVLCVLFCPMRSCSNDVNDIQTATRLQKQEHSAHTDRHDQMAFSRSCSAKCGAVRRKERRRAEREIGTVAEIQTDTNSQTAERKNERE